MKTRLLTLLFLFTLLLTTAGQAVAQAFNTMGTDFWCVLPTRLVSSESCCFYYSSPQNATITFSHPSTNWTTTRTVAANSVGDFTISAAQIGKLRMTSSASVTNTGFHITSDVPISLYVAHQGTTSCDITYVLPTSTLGQDYLIEPYPALSESGLNSRAKSTYFVMMGTADNTHISYTIKPTATAAPQTFNITLDAGQSYQQTAAVPTTQAGILYDISGTHVTADKPIAIFQGSFTTIPHTLTQGNWLDQMLDQCIPTCYWGTQFIVAKHDCYYASRVRVTAKEDNCSVYKNGSLLATLQSGETHEFAPTSTSSPDLITTTTPAACMLFMGSSNNNDLYQGRYGDPTICYIAPTDQMCTQTTYLNPNLSGYQHSLFVLCETAHTSEMTLDGASLVMAPVPNAPQYSFYHSSTIAGRHTLANPNGYLAYTYGKGFSESYSYTVGMALQAPPDTLFAEMRVDGTPATLRPSTEICEGDSLSFALVSDKHANTILWNTGDGFTTTDSAFTHVFPTAGSYETWVEATFNVNGADTVFRDTIEVIVHPNYHNSHNDTIVENQLPWTYGGNTYTGPVSNQRTLTSIDGCDSVEDYSLHVWYNSTRSVDTSICNSLLPFTWHGHTFATAGTFVDSFTDSHGADSVVSYNLTVISCTIKDTSICDTLFPFIWYSQTFDAPETRTVVHTDRNGNDSIVTYIVESHYCLPIEAEKCGHIFLPNAFTPEATTNNLFGLDAPCLSYLKMYIYDRRGDLVAEFEGLGKKWDGRHNGVMCKKDSYVYHIEYKLITHPNLIYHRTGNVLLLR